MPIETFSANRELVRALNSNGARYLVVGGSATKYYVPDRPTEHANELDLLVEKTVPNIEKVLAALQSIGYWHPDYTVERLVKPGWTRLPVDNGSLYADILTPDEAEDVAGYWQRARDETIGHMSVKVISNEDQQARLARSELEKHKRDIELLKAAQRK